MHVSNVAYFAVISMYFAVQNGKKHTFIKGAKKEGTALNFLKPFGRFSLIYLGISLTQQEVFLIFEISNFPI